MSGLSAVRPSHEGQSHRHLRRGVLPYCLQRCNDPFRLHISIFKEPVQIEQTKHIFDLSSDAGLN